MKDKKKDFARLKSITQTRRWQMSFSVTQQDQSYDLLTQFLNGGTPSPQAKKKQALILFFSKSHELFLSYRMSNFYLHYLYL